MSPKFDREDNSDCLRSIPRLVARAAFLSGAFLFIPVAASRAEEVVTSSSTSQPSPQPQGQSQQSSSGTQGQNSSSSSSTPSSTDTTNTTTLDAKVEQIQEVLSTVTSPSTETQEVVEDATTQTQEAEAAATAVTTTAATVTTATSNLTSATTTANTAASTLTQAQTADATAQTAVTTQTPVVTQAATNAATAQAEAAAASTSSTITETFTNNQRTTDMVITVNGVPVSTTYTNGVQINSWNNSGPVTGGTLSDQHGPGILINPVQDATSMSFDSFAKNGDSPVTVTFTDGTTTTVNYANNVAQNIPGYTSTVTIQAPEGKAIASIKIEATNDYHIIDNITAAVQTTDPALAQAAQEAQATYTQAQALLTSLQADANATAQQLADAQAAASAAQQNLSSATYNLQSAQLASTAAIANAPIQTQQAELAVADAQVAVSQEATTQLSTAVTALATANSNIVGTTATDTAVSTAQAAVTAAQAAIDAALDKKDIADGLQEAAGANVTVASATDVVEDKTAVLAVAEDAVDAQVVVVDDAQIAKDAAQAVVNASTTPGLQVTVYNTQGQNNAPVVTANTPILNTFIDTNGISEQWGSGVVAGSGRVDDVVVKYEGVWTPTYTGTQYVHHAADDGTRLILDGVVVSEAWYDKGGGGPTVDIETVAGQSRQFEFWYYENGGGAAVVLMRYTDSGWEVIPGSEFTISNASQAEKDALSAAATTLNTETNILTSLEATETQAQQNLVTAQATLVLAQSAELARDEYVELAQDAIDATVEAIQVVAASTTIVNAQVAYESQPINAPTNVVVTQLSSGDVQVTWSAPETGIEPER